MYICVGKHTCTCNVWAKQYMQKYTCIYVWASIHVHVMCGQNNTCKNIHVCVHVWTKIYMYICVGKHMYM